MGVLRLVVLGAALSLSSLGPVEALGLGALKLDNYTFDKVIGLPDLTFLVKIDQSYAYGDAEDAFRFLAKLSYSVPKFLMAEIPVSEYGEMENDGMRERFGLTKADFPAYFLFNEANKEGIRYRGAATADDLSVWLRRQGIRMPAIGTLGELDELVQKFMKDKSTEHVVAASKLAEGQYSNDRKADMYLKIMQKVQVKGDAYVDGEVTRLTKLLEGRVTPEKKEELTDKMKILSVFAAKDEL